MRTVVIAAALAATLAACRPATEAAHEAAPLATRIVAVEASDVPATREVPGTVRARVSADLAARTPGNVARIHVREGDRVRAGQLLVELDVTELDAQLARARAAEIEVDSAVAGAEAALAAAESQYGLTRVTLERFEALRERRSVSPQEFDEVAARHRAATAERERARRALEGARAQRRRAGAEAAGAGAVAAFGRILAPFDGVIARKYVDVGAQALPGVPLLRIEADGAFRLDAMVDESLAAALAPGDAITVRVDAAGRTLAARVAEVVPALDAATRTFVAKLDLPADPALRSGMFGRARIPVGTRRAIVVPSEALSRVGQLERVWTVDETGTARLRLVRAGSEIGDGIEILSGLEPGERIVVAGPAGLAEGRPVVQATGDQG